VQTREKVLPMVAGCLKIKISGTPAKAYSLTLLPHYYLLKACVFQICEVDYTGSHNYKNGNIKYFHEEINMLAHNS